MRALLWALSVLIALLALLVVASTGLRITRFDLNLATLIASIALAIWIIWRTRDDGLTPINILLIIVALVLIFFTFGGVLLMLGPIWTLSVIGCLLIAAVIAQWRRNRNLPCRPDSILCRECGCDLRDAQERCPQCDTPIPEDLRRRRRIAAGLAHERQRP